MEPVFQLPLWMTHILSLRIQAQYFHHRHKDEDLQMKVFDGDDSQSEDDMQSEEEEYKEAAEMNSNPIFLTERQLRLFYETCIAGKGKRERLFYALARRGKEFITVGDLKPYFICLLQIFFMINLVISFVFLSHFPFLSFFSSLRPPSYSS